MIDKSSTYSHEQHIRIRGARTHNLKNIDLDLPRNKLVVITGVSGSGKSSLAFDTLYAEGQRRYVESLSSYARQFLGRFDKPDVDLIEGLSPAISIEQKTTNHNPRSTVGTVTEIHDYLRLLFARVGTPHCPEHGLPLLANTVSQIVDAVLALPAETPVILLAPLLREKKGPFTEIFTMLRSKGYLRVRVDGQMSEIDDLPEIKNHEPHDIDVVVDRLKVRPAARTRLAESIEAVLEIGGTLTDGRVLVFDMSTGREHFFSTKLSCPICGFLLKKLEPRLFSFNAPTGACPHCEGLGYHEVFDPARVVAFPELSLASGAITGWDRRNSFYFSLIESLAQHYNFDVEIPFKELPKEVQQVVLHGSGQEIIAFNYPSRRGENDENPVVQHHPFEGILPNMERRWRETDSAPVREKLARLRTLQRCSECDGARLRPEARHVLVGEGAAAQSIQSISSKTLLDAFEWFNQLRLVGSKADVATVIVREIIARLSFLNNVGLSYLSLDRGAATLSGGEAQRIRLASQIGSGLCGVMYVLDEPSIGLHQRDNARLIATLQRLRDLGNSVIVVEHDEDMIRAADYVVDMGPGAGVHGGSVIAQGTPTALCAVPESLTGQFLAGTRSIALPKQRTAWRRAEENGVAQALRIVGAAGNNLHHITVNFPVGLITCVTGVSGSGKSTLVNDTLYRAAAHLLQRAQTEPAAYESIQGLQWFDKVVNADQSPIGRTPRSNPATYTGIFTAIRELLSETDTARERGYGPGRFSFNVAGGRCEACQGDGVVKVEMHFLPDVYVPCDVCKGQRYNRETLEVRWKGCNIAQILEMTVQEAHSFFKNVPSIARKLQTLLDVGLSYLRLGQSATTLSGGEAQRVKLALELSRRETGRTLYILDEPTTGLHFADIALLLHVLEQLRAAGNTIVIIEHNLDVIKTADWVIDMGPEGGAGGGMVVAEGTPETVATHPDSHTGRYLANYFNQC